MRYLTIFLCTLLPGVVMAIEVSGDVSGVWGPDDNPYQVVGDLRVPRESTLAILPGCRIEFQGHYKFVVDSLATFSAVGTETDSIIFTNDDTLTGWHGIRFMWAASTNELAYCRLQWGRAAGVNPNDTLTNGGAVYALGTSLSVSNCRFQFNRAWEGFGGCIYAEQSNLSVSNCVMEHNRSGWGGAAIYGLYSQVAITGSTFAQDSTWYALGGEVGGGAIGCVHSNVEITGNVISRNFCGMSGGGIMVRFSNSMIMGNVISSNECWDFGGGIYARGPTIAAYNQLYGNYNFAYPFASGGGIACGDSVTLINNTIVGNYSGYAGGGIYTWAAAPIDTFKNNIVWGNVAYFDSQIHLYLEEPSIVYNNIQGGWPGEGNIDADPLFAGPGDFHLTWANYPIEDSTKSPCIDTGDPSSPPDSDDTRADMGALFFDRRAQDIIEDPIPLPQAFILLQNYPNPFNYTTMVQFALPRTEHMSLSLFDVCGGKVAEIYDGVMEAGSHKLRITMQDVASGVYFLVLKTEKAQITRKMLLLK